MLSEYIGANKGRLIECWKERVNQRLAIKLDESQLVNDLPDFLDDVVAALRQKDNTWPALDSAQSHGRHRMRSGTDMGSLVEEMSVVIEVVIELARADERGLSSDEMICLSRVLGRGTAASANAYTALRDQELARQAQKHFSFIAHELRTPLQTAQLAVRVLDSLLSDEHAKYLKRIDRAVSRVIELVDNALVEVRLSGKPELHLQQVGAKEVAQTLLEQLKGHLDDKELQLFIDAEEVYFDADEKLLLSALTNLVRNAIKFTPSGHRIRVRAYERADRAIFEVEDECGGMPDDVPGRLFQPFFQTNTDKTGHGLGLMIVKQAAEAHGGSVHVNNRPPNGCVFVMKLPLRQPGTYEGNSPKAHGEDA